MALKEMTTLTLEGSDEVYEIVDELARQEIAKLKADSGGTKIFNVNFTTSDVNTYTKDKSYAEIKQAFLNGIPICGYTVIDMSESGYGVTPAFQITSVYYDMFEEYISFNFVSTSNDLKNTVFVTIRVSSDESVTMGATDTFATMKDVDKKIAEAIGTVENGSY